MPNRTAAILTTVLAPLIWGSTYSRYHRISAAEPPVHRRVYPCIARRAVAVGVDAADTQTGRMGDGCLARFFEHRLFSGHAVCGGVPLAGRFGGGAEFHANADGAGVHLADWQNHAPKAAWGWAAAGVAGIALLVLSPQARYDTLGILAALAGAAAMALGVYLSKHRRTSLPVLAFTGWQLFIGGLCLLPVALLAEPPLEALSAANLGGYLYLCLFGAVLAYVLWFDGIAKLPPAAVSSLGLLSPVCAFVLGWLFLGQGMDAKSLAGFALVLASIFGVQRAVGKAT